MTARDDYIASVKTAHVAAEVAGITPNTGATVTPTGNLTSWSRVSARAALAAGSITQSQFVSVMHFLTMIEQVQVTAAKDVLRAAGEIASGA
jgi:hypothetical protein